jgi:hypothetical protein
MTRLQYSVSSLFNIPTSESVEHSPGIYIDKPGRLAGLAELLSHTLTYTGEELRRLGIPDLATFLLRCARPLTADDPFSGAMGLVRALCTQFQALDDRETVQIEAEGHVFQLSFCTNALRMVEDLTTRFGEHFRFEEADETSPPCVAAPKCAAISTLFQRGILTPVARTDEVGESMALLSETPVTCTITRTAAVCAIARITELLRAKSTIHANDPLLAVRVSLYLDMICDAQGQQFTPSAADKW